VTFVRYSLLRLMLLLGVLVALWLVGGLWAPLRDPVWLVLATAVLSVVLSYFVLRVPREAMTQQIADRLATRPSGPVLDDDAEAEDAEVDDARTSAQRQPQPEQDAEGQLGAPGVAQHGDQPEAGGTGADDPNRRPQQHG
jgi:hypothetical protein